MHLDILLLQEVKVDPRQALGIRSRLKSAGCGASIAFASLPPAPQAPGRRTGKQAKRGGLAAVGFGGCIPRHVSFIR
eukprot:4790489-Alexandrium_andersonii.AAC.1